MYHLIIDLVLLQFCIVDLYFWLVNLCYQTESKIGEKCTDSVILDINMGSENNRWFFWAWNFIKQFWNMCLGRIISMWLINQDSISNFTFYLHTFTFWQKNGISENEIPQKFHNYKVYSCVHSWIERIFCWKKTTFLSLWSENSKSFNQELKQLRPPKVNT